MYRNRLIESMLAWLDDWKGDADLIVGVTLDKDLMKNKAGVTAEARKGQKSIILGYDPGAGTANSKFVLAHELGHMEANLDDEYSDDSVGKTAEPGGWYFAKNEWGETKSMGPRINIWTKSSTNNIYDEKIEDGTPDLHLNMGPLYLNIMGLFYMDNSWIDLTSYLKILDALNKKGIIVKGN
jgi:hypothetical protein